MTQLFSRAKKHVVVIVPLQSEVFTHDDSMLEVFRSTLNVFFLDFLMLEHSIFNENSMRSGPRKWSRCRLQPEFAESGVEMDRSQSRSKKNRNGVPAKIIICYRFCDAHFRVKKYSFEILFVNAKSYHINEIIDTFFALKMPYIL